MNQHRECTISCQNCSISQLCLPFSLNERELGKLDDIIQRKRPFQKNERLFQSGDKLSSLYAVRSGSFKSFTLAPDGEEQIIAFHLPGDIIGFDAVSTQEHKSFAQALETSMVCEIPFNTLETLSGDLPRLRSQVMRMMSSEILEDQEMFLLLNKRTAHQRLAYFLTSLASRYQQRGFSATQFRLSMTRAEIGNYLGLTVETISRLLTRFQKQELIKVEGKFITLLQPQVLKDGQETAALLG
ncbi:fumarate/nitrate reduction transcriptional regulator Fnr [Aliiglaciecola sp. CAU 1673]|uniref:fumarate/nitrate reduction transcriptional regulator Fnr n=1 Tax=Aliiglaciecola sp. CAU 1673 TaxID=3032595 RepID=UPI0023DB22F1|nr:fumarate/nitrate reduction transcriptional regulator Fnr [Aliiglaciecola sp. CAU 1673]MDF2180159.1 fumarate/nitrate reduction transcriptional regulator Fnr [Aliiglaciecola sp. CAU 1673]